MKKVKKILSFSLVVFFAFSCQEKKKFKVTVDFSKSTRWDKETSPKSVTFLKEGGENGEIFYDTLATVPLSKEGIAIFQGEIERPVFSRLSIGAHKNRIKRLRPKYDFALSPEDINITFTGDNIEPKITGMYNIWGTNIKNDKNVKNAFEKYMNSHNEYMSVYRERENALNNNNIALARKLQPKLTENIQRRNELFESFEKIKNDVTEALIHNKKGTLSVYEEYLIYNTSRTKITSNKWKEFTTRMKEELGENDPLYNSFVEISSFWTNYYTSSNRFPIGNTYKDFTIPTLEGKEVKLSDFVKKGNYVLLDFWASWCAPCREEFPHIIKAYNKYKNKGFEVFSVSLDHKREAWKKASRKDKLQWINTSSLRAKKCSVVKSYGIYGVPASFLIDPNGKIIAKDLRGFDLEYKLEEIFN